MDNISILNSLTQKAVEQGIYTTSMLRGKTLACFDIETTSLEYLEGEVIEIGVIKYDIDNITCTPSNKRMFNVLIKPSVPIGSETTRITGITNELLDNEGIERHMAFDMFVNFMEDVDILVHQNGNRFDMGFITFHMVKNVIERGIESTIWSVHTSIDTLEVSKVQLPGGKHNLKDLCIRYGVEYDPDSHHRAVYDCEITLGVFFRQLETLNFMFINDIASPSHMAFINEISGDIAVPHILHESQIKAITTAFANANV